MATGTSGAHPPFDERRGRSVDGVAELPVAQLSARPTERDRILLACSRFSESVGEPAGKGLRGDQAALFRHLAGQKHVNVVDAPVPVADHPLHGHQHPTSQRVRVGHAKRVVNGFHKHCELGVEQMRRHRDGEMREALQCGRAERHRPCVEFFGSHQRAGLKF